MIFRIEAIPCLGSNVITLVVENIGREEIELQRFDLIDEIYSKGCTYDRNMRHTIVLVFVRPKLRVNPVIKKYGGQKGGDDSESFRFIAAR